MTHGSALTLASQGWVGVLSPGGVLAAAIAAALGVLGWTCVPLGTASQPLPEPARPGPPEPPPPAGPPRAVLLIADRGAGAPPPVDRRPPPPEGTARYPPVIGVGGGPAMSGFALLAQRGLIDAVVDADLPLARVVEALDDVLTGRRPAPPPGGLGAALRRRAEEAHRCDRLSRRESVVLAEILRGRSAAELAAAEHVSLPTIRTQIRGVLSKLEVGSQVAAAAVAHRSWDGRPLDVFVS